jgi:hypothetical protein
VPGSAQLFELLLCVGVAPFGHRALARCGMLLKGNR